MDLFWTIIAYTLRAYIYLSVFVVFYSVVVGRDLDIKPIFGKKFFGKPFFYIGGFLGLTFLLSAGFEEFLFIIPDSWGSIDEYGEWQSTKETLSYLLAFFLGWWILFKADETASQNNKNNNNETK